jgi:hypothetical protein
VHGELTEDGKWSGIIGMLADRQVEVSCADLTMTSSRVDVVDFIEPVWNDRCRCKQKNLSCIIDSEIYTITSV